MPNLGHCCGSDTDGLEVVASIGVRMSHTPGDLNGFSFTLAFIGQVDGGFEFSNSPDGDFFADFVERHLVVFGCFDSDDSIPSAQTGFPSRIARHGTSEDRWGVGDTDSISRCGHQDAEDEVHDDPGADDDHASKDRFGRIGPRIEFGGVWGGGFLGAKLGSRVITCEDSLVFLFQVAWIVVLAKHLDVAT